MFFDSHAHLDDARFNEDRQLVIESLKGNDISNIINIGADMKSSVLSLEYAEKYDFIYAAAGVHPSETSTMTADDIDRLEELLKHNKCVALGEIGLDYYYESTDKKTQRLWFEEQCLLAKRLDMPVIIHDRDAHEESFEMVKKHGLRGVFHCFSSSKEVALKLVDIGFYVSFTGVLTFKNAKKAVAAAEALPIERILIETDCPYMAPEPHRGKRNEPHYVRHVAEKLAQIKGLSLEDTAKITSDNTKCLFGIK